MSTHDTSFQLTSNPAGHTGAAQRMALMVVGVGCIALMVAAFGAGSAYPLASLLLGVGLIATGGTVYILKEYNKPVAGVQNNGIMFSKATARGAIGWVLGILITGFYILLYFHSDLAGADGRGPLEHLIRTVDPLSNLLRGKPADQWFLYGTLYTVAILVMGLRAILKYRHNRYQIIRTLSVMFFQLVLAYLVPAVLQLINKPEFYFTYFWPLKYDYLFPDTVKTMEAAGGFSAFAIRWAILMTVVGTPVFTYFFGKRWYCSWVCGCGGLAETAGDPYRQLSSKKLSAWRIERWMIYSVLAMITVITVLLWLNDTESLHGMVLGGAKDGVKKFYGLVIGSIFSGVIGVGFYPIMGARVWCRFGCPMAAVLGLLQRTWSRFRITTNGGQCISCGNCSTYCEMGIDVRAYAQRGENIIRASCVGCGVCATVCPRGVLSLENGPREGRYNGGQFVSADLVEIPRIK